MKHIDQYLGKKNLTKALDKKKECIDILSQETGISPETKYVSFSGKTVFLKIHPHEKTQVLMRKKSILDHFSKSKTLSFFTDIQ
jgi:hypothetical protein